MDFKILVVTALIRPVFSASINSASKIRDKVMSVGGREGSITVSSVSDAHVAVAVKDAGVTM